MSLTLVVRKAIIDDIISQKGEVYKAFQNYLVQGCFKYLHKSKIFEFLKTVKISFKIPEKNFFLYYTSILTYNFIF